MFAGTASGKTTVCDLIYQRLHDDSAVVMLSQVCVLPYSTPRLLPDCFCDSILFKALQPISAPPLLPPASLLDANIPPQLAEATNQQQTGMQRMPPRRLSKAHVCA